MKRIGQVTYELTEEEYDVIKQAIGDMYYYFNNDTYKDDAVEGFRRLERIFED